MSKVQRIDIKRLIDEFEVLFKTISDSSSPKSYTDLFMFLKTYLNPKQVYLWKYKECLKSKKKKFLSLNKSKIDDFESIYSDYSSLNFNDKSYYRNNENFYLRVPSRNGTDFYCLAIEKMGNKNFIDEIAEYIFSQRLSGIFHFIDKIDELQNLNFIDDVTGLYNQRYLNVLLDQEMEKFKRSQQPFCVLFIDVDHFKSINDKNGHLVGSQILKEIGTILKSAVRSVDFCFRYGGDEFLIVLTKTESKPALQVAERICQSIRDTSFIVGGVQVHVTLSIGVAGFPEHAQTKEKILQKADEAMYCGKNISRNIVYLAG